MDLKAVEHFISRQSVSFVCSVYDEGCPNVKAMLKPRKRIGVKEFWFSTNTSSMRVRQPHDSTQWILHPLHSRHRNYLQTSCNNCAHHYCYYK